MVGHSILHYRIVEELGQGGMGIVYLAEDTNLERKVAIKFLPHNITANHEDRERFKTEARSAAALNHPNIATIHAIEEYNDEQFIVMEYIDGKELKDIINNNPVGAENFQPLPQDDLINYAGQIANGLSAAHKKGIIHRDIKSSNIMVTGEGQIKIMDFGIAKLQREVATTANLSTGGTANYMSPEQATGEPVDLRSDIWSFGVVLYEMLTGDLPFKGKHESGILYSIVNSEPQEIENKDYPDELTGIVRKALIKNPDERYQSIEEVLIDLKSVTESRPNIESAYINKNKKYWFAGVTVIVLLVLTLSIYLVNNETAGDLPNTRTIRFTSYPGEEYNPVISPDGNFVAFSWNGPQQDNFDIYVKRIDGGDPQRLTSDPRTDTRPEWSPDGISIAFIRRLKSSPIANWNAIYTIPSLGGREKKVIEFDPPSVGPMRSISWSKDNKFIYYTGWREADKGNVILKVSVESRKSEQITHLPEAMWGDQSPRVSHDGNFLGFIRAGDGMNIFIMNLKDQELQQVTTIDADWINGFCWNSDNRSILFAADLDGSSSLWKVDLGGGNPGKIISGGNISDPYVSSTGERLVYIEIYQNTNIWKVDTDSPNEESLLVNSSALHNLIPAISPDGKKIAFFSNRTGSYNLWMCDQDGSNQTQVTFDDLSSPQNLKWSPDGSEILICTDHGLYLLNASVGHPEMITDQFSDGDWTTNGNVIYCSRNNEMYLISKNGEIKNQITKEGIFPQVYGKYIYYMKGYYYRQIWRIPVEGGEEEPILQGVDDIGMKLWTVVKSGIYYIRKNNGSPILKYLDFKSKKSLLIKEMPDASVLQHTTIDIDPNEQYLLYSKKEPTKSDIILVENFRTE